MNTCTRSCPAELACGVCVCHTTDIQALHPSDWKSVLLLPIGHHWHLLKMEAERTSRALFIPREDKKQSTRFLLGKLKLPRTLCKTCPFAYTQKSPVVAILQLPRSQ